MNIAIDLGSDRTRVYIENQGKVLDEASVITYDVDTHEIFAVGDEAYAMIGKTPVGIRAAHPLDGGVIAQSDLVDPASSPRWKSGRLSMPSAPAVHARSI